MSLRDKKIGRLRYFVMNFATYIIFATICTLPYFFEMTPLIKEITETAEITGTLASTQILSIPFYFFYGSDFEMSLPYSFALSSPFWLCLVLISIWRCNDGDFNKKIWCTAQLFPIANLISMLVLSIRAGKPKNLPKL